MVKNLTNNSVAKTLLKGIKKGLDSTVGKVVTSPWFSVGVAGGFSAVNAYFDEGSEAYKNVGKSVVCGIIDGVASIGSIDGALIGAQIAGPMGAGLGFLGGLSIQFAQIAFPNATNILKGGAYKLVDNMTEIGKSIGQNISSVVDMTRNIYDGSFKESENFVTDDYVQKVLLKSELKVVRKRFIGVMVTLSFIIIIYYFSIFLEAAYPEADNIIPARFGNAWTIICILVFIFYCVLKRIQCHSSAK